MATGAAKYIATGRSYASMTSSFVDLYQRYAIWTRLEHRWQPHTHAQPLTPALPPPSTTATRARTSFFAFELIVLCVRVSPRCRPASRHAIVAARLYTHQPGYFLLYTWPVWLVALAILLSPWAFNPKSFEWALASPHAPLLHLLLYRPLRPHAPRVSRVARPERADSKTSWPEWHAAALSAQRRQSTGRRLQRVALSLIPKAIAFAGATAALRVDRFGHASFRSLLAFVYAARRPPPAPPLHPCSADDNTSSLIRPTHGDKL